nr:unnamed protein product [Callosobruchus chinensis]
MISKILLRRYSLTQHLLSALELVPTLI